MCPSYGPSGLLGDSRDPSGYNLVYNKYIRISGLRAILGTHSSNLRFSSLGSRVGVKGSSIEGRGLKVSRVGLGV